MKKFEVEQKYRLRAPAALRAKLRALKARKISGGAEINHVYPLTKLGIPGILRLRRDSRGGKLTFKGPRLKSAFKKRIEIETPVNYQEMKLILDSLNPGKPFFYAKTREEYVFGKVLVTLDQVKGHGWFAEIEGPAMLIRPAAAKLGLKESDREERTYLEMLGWKRPAAR